MTQPLNHFAAAFSAYHETAGLNLRAIALATGLSGGDLSRIRAGKKRATLDTLHKLIAKIKPEQAAPLVAAFLKDHRPAGFEGLVQVELKTVALASLSRYQQAIDTLSRLEGNPALRRHIISTAETLAHLLKSQPPAPAADTAAISKLKRGRAAHRSKRPAVTPKAPRKAK